MFGMARWTQAPVHFLVIPKLRAGLTQLSKAVPEHKMLLGHLMFVAQEVAKQGACVYERAHATVCAKTDVHMCVA